MTLGQWKPSPGTPSTLPCSIHLLGSQSYCCSAVSDSLTTWAAARQASLSLTVSWSLLRLMSFELVISSNNLILCRPLLLLPSTFLSIRVFSSELALHIVRWPKYWSFGISSSNEYSGLISFQFSSVAPLCLTFCGPHGLQHARLPCQLTTSGAYTNSCRSSW